MPGVPNYYYSSLQYYMKVLHTSDWHLGHTLYNYDRYDEQSQMLNQITHIVTEEQPDVFVLAGDVYHTSQPSAAVQTLFTDAIVKIHQACPDMVIVIIAGNHDSSSKHEIFRSPWLALGVHVIGNINKNNPGDHIIEIPGKGFVVAIPYVNYRNMPQDFVQQVLDLVDERNGDHLPVVMTAHTTIAGCDFNGHDHNSELTIGGINAIDLNNMGDGYDYLALGHIHHNQWVQNSKQRARYSGSPLAVSFDECYRHTVSIVDIQHHGDSPSLREIEILNPHPLVSLPSNTFAPLDEAMLLLNDFTTDNPAYIRLNVQVDGSLPPEATSQAIALAEQRNCRFCLINPKRNVTTTADPLAMSVQEFQAEQPIDIACRYAEYNNITFDDNLKTLFNEVLDIVNEEQRNN